MAPKTANTGVKRQTGNLNSWLKTPSRGNGQHKRARSTSNSMNASETVEKKQRTSLDASVEPSCETRGASSDTKSASQSKVKSDSNDGNTLTINESTGDIFAAPPNTLIIHACNCQGSWGGGIALAFRKHYPEAFKVYSKHCRDNDAQSLLGTALLIPPTDSNVSAKGPVGAPRINSKSTPSKPQTQAKKNQHFIGCLFTSNYYGKRKDSPSKILSATGPSMQDLLKQVRVWNAAHTDGERVGEVRICKINSGLFAVPWRETVGVIEGIEVGEGGVSTIEVLERE